MLRIRGAAAIAEEQDLVAALDRRDPETEHLLKRRGQRLLRSVLHRPVIVKLAVKVV